MLLNQDKKVDEIQLSELREALEGSVKHFKENILRSYFDFHVLGKKFPNTEEEYETVKREIEVLEIEKGKSHKHKEKQVEAQSKKNRLETILAEFEKISNRIEGAKQTIKLLKKVVGDDNELKDILKEYENYKLIKEEKRAKAKSSSKEGGDKK